jgi:hypothetical protein
MATSVSVHPHSIVWRGAGIAVAALVAVLAVLALTIGFGGNSAAKPTFGPGTPTTYDSHCYPTHPTKPC